MTVFTPTRKQSGPHLAKSPSGIAGLDEITGGGLPTGRPTLICGNAGCGSVLTGTNRVLQQKRDLESAARKSGPTPDATRRSRASNGAAAPRARAAGKRR